MSRMRDGSWAHGAVAGDRDGQSGSFSNDIRIHGYPMTERHTCGACACHVPVDAAVDQLLAKVARLAAELRKCRTALSRGDDDG